MGDKYSAITFREDSSGTGHKLKAERQDSFQEIDLRIELANGFKGEYTLAKLDAIELAEWILEEFTGGE